MNTEWDLSEACKPLPPPKHEYPLPTRPGWWVCDGELYQFDPTEDGRLECANDATVVYEPWEADWYGPLPLDDSGSVKRFRESEV